ncbi:hypothetical protein SHIRM173S_08060 [Streptomyces hirsutus]
MTCTEDFPVVAEYEVKVRWLPDPDTWGVDVVAPGTTTRRSGAPGAVR